MALVKSQFVVARGRHCADPEEAEAGEGFGCYVCLPDVECCLLIAEFPMIDPDDRAKVFILLADDGGIVEEGAGLLAV